MDVPRNIRRPDTAELFEKLFVSSPDGIIVVDREGHITEANPQIESFFGYLASELLGSPVEILIPERFHSVHKAHRTAYSNRPAMRPMGSELNLYGRRKDGSEFPIDVMLSPVETTGGLLVLCVVRDMTERKRLEEGMRHLALSDPLTGLGNYRRLQEAFETETKWFRRTGRPLALLLLDLDGLKKINDTYGHAVGSHALVRLANVLRAECRAVDTAVRHGGDEFAVILPDTGAEGAKELASRLTGRLSQDGEDPPISFCYGVGVSSYDQETLDQLLAVADRALYAMKRLRTSKPTAPGS